MKVNLLNINLDCVPAEAIINIAKDLGCNYKTPVKKENKYSKEILRRLMNGKTEIDDDLIDAETEENKKINKMFKVKCSLYFDSIMDWLKEHNYIQYIEQRFPHFLFAIVEVVMFVELNIIDNYKKEDGRKVMIVDLNEGELV